MNGGRNLTLAMLLVVASTLLPIVLTSAQEGWQPAGERIKTEWAAKVDPLHPLSEYPRPNMERSQWVNLNGLWDYKILPLGSAVPSEFEGKILVPFPLESSLSGVQKSAGPEQELWYNRAFRVPSSWKGKKILLNFGAVDWKSDIWINGVKAASHTGGYTPFSVDISPLLSGAGEQTLTVRVWDPADKGYQPRGKQVARPGGIFYTSVTGIWQTVWLEPVSESYIDQIKAVPNIDAGTLTAAVNVRNAAYGDMIEVKMLDGTTTISTARAICGQEVLLSISQAKLWSPENPFLYQLEISLLRNGQAIDKIKSYAGMRKISLRQDAGGIMRMQLNNKDYFQFGLLDQGWWPDGLYTAPTDEALLYDIKKTKELGFNLIRKHVKVEPARWYYHCDKEGILVWQDMPSGDRSPEWQQRNYFKGQEFHRSSQSEENFKKEWQSIIDMLYSSPSVVMWVPFNEAWGQFKTPEITEWTKSYDPSRLVNPASGGNFYETGDVLDIHNYPEPALPLYDSRRTLVLGEYGGIGLPVENHMWHKDQNWGYVKYKTSAEATDAYVQLAEKLKKLIPQGFSAAIYTQTTDVESETNGLMTYDRKIIKMDKDRLRKINQEIVSSLQ